MKRILVLLFSLSLLTACLEKTGASGRIGDQIKGKNFSLQAFYLSAGNGKEDMPSINLTNDSNQTITIAPLTVTAWFKQAGKKEMTYKAGEMLGNEQIAPHKTVMLSTGSLKSDVGPSDQLDRLRLSIANGQEVFTISP